MTSAEMQQGGHDQWLYLHCWPAAGCWISSSCGVCSPAVFARTVQCCLQCWLPGYPAPALLSPSLPLHPPFLPKGVMTHGVVCDSPLEQGYNSSSRGVYPVDSTYAGFCFAVSVFRGFEAVMAALHWLDLFNYCLIMTTLCCLFVILCRNGCGGIWMNSHLRKFFKHKTSKFWKGSRGI